MPTDSVRHLEILALIHLLLERKLFQMITEDQKLLLRGCFWIRVVSNMKIS